MEWAILPQSIIALWPVLTSRPTEGRGRVEAELANWVAGYIPRWCARPKTVTHASTSRHIVRWPGIELTTIESRVWRPDYTKPVPKSYQSLLKSKRWWRSVLLSCSSLTGARSCCMPCTWDRPPTTSSCPLLSCSIRQCWQRLWNRPGILHTIMMYDLFSSSSRPRTVEEEVEDGTFV